MQRGLKMFLMKILFVVSWFLQLPKVLSSSPPPAALKPIKGKALPAQSPAISVTERYCDRRSCLVAICETDESIGELVQKHTNPTTAATQTPSDLSQHIPTTDEWEVLQQWDPLTAIDKIKPRNGYCALVLNSAKEKVKALCQSYCDSRFSCEWPNLDKADKATISRLAAKKEIMRCQLEKEEQWKRASESLTAKIKTAEKVKEKELQNEQNPPIRRNRWGIPRLIQQPWPLEYRREIVKERNDKIIRFLNEWLQQHKTNPPCTTSPYAWH